MAASRRSAAARCVLVEPVTVVSGSALSVFAARLQRCLPLQHLVELLLVLLLVEELTAGDAVDLRAQFRDPVLVGELHFGLACDE